jgi:hypothetical protein
MALVLKRIRVYAKLVAIVALAIVVIAVIVMNRQNTVTVWFFSTYEINVLWLMTATAGVSVLTWYFLVTSLALWRDMRDLQQADLLAVQHRRQEETEKRLKEAEDRIDRKVSDATQRESDES